jgi:hypothetical protein
MLRTIAMSGLFAALSTLVLLSGCDQAAPPSGQAGASAGAERSATRPPSRWTYHDWPTGHYRVVENWPKPLPDTRHSHDGWTWGSFGGVYAESPDRIWLAMRGELPLPEARRRGRRTQR